MNSSRNIVVSVLYSSSCLLSRDSLRALDCYRVLVLSLYFPFIMCLSCLGIAMSNGSGGRISPDESATRGGWINKEKITSHRPNAPVMQRRAAPPLEYVRRTHYDEAVATFESPCGSVSWGLLPETIHNGLYLDQIVELHWEGHDWFIQASTPCLDAGSSSSLQPEQTVQVIATRTNYARSRRASSVVTSGHVVQVSGLHSPIHSLSLQSLRSCRP